MIFVAKKIPVVRYCFILLLVSILFAGLLYLLLHYKRAHQLQTSVESLISARENSALVDSCIINLYSADNNSRLYTITGDKIYLNKFSKEVRYIGKALDRLKIDRKLLAGNEPENFKALINDKKQKTDTYIKLRRLTDSLIRYSKKMDRSTIKVTVPEQTPEVKIQHVVTYDTIKQAAAAKPKKKFFGRLFAAFKNRKEEEKPHVFVVRKDTEITTTPSATKQQVQTAKLNYKNYYKKLDDVNEKLKRNEHQILVINNNLIGQIIADLRLYKSVEQQYINKSKNELRESLSNVFFEYKRLSMATIAFLVLLLVAVFYNIWKIFRNDVEIIEYSEKAEQYAKSKSRFLAGMSHEIRTPLNSVIGFSEQLGQAEELGSEQKMQVDAIRNSSEMLLELVNEILDFSKYETGKMNFESSPFMLGKAIDEIFNSMNVHAVKKHLYLENQVSIDESVCCEGDKMRLKQVIMNLVGNAIKFTVKGKVTLIASTETMMDNNILLRVTVKDTGLGIDKADLPHIFEEFSQVAEAQKATRHKGTGLGLAICKKIIELQGGKICVASEPGQGSAFTFEMPLKKAVPEEILDGQIMSDETMASLVRDAKVLFTEDNQLNVLLGTTILKKWKINYDVAYNGREAMDLFKENNYDVILTDIQMPEMNGLELTELIRNYPDISKANVPIMALTANVMKEDREIYLKAGVNDVILKPFLEKNLIEKVAMAIQNDQSVLRFVS